VVLFWNDQLTLSKVIGIVLMLVCFVLSVKTDDDDSKKRKTNIKWFLLSLTASICTGGIGILQKMHQTSVYRNEIFGFLIVSFLCSAVLSLILVWLTGTAVKKVLLANMSVLPFLVLAGIGAAFNHIINLYLSGAMESAVFFPVMSGGELVFVTAASIAVFKERLSSKQWAGLICGIFATVILCM